MARPSNPAHVLQRDATGLSVARHPGGLSHPERPARQSWPIEPAAPAMRPGQRPAWTTRPKQRSLDSIVGYSGHCVPGSIYLASLPDRLKPWLPQASGGATRQHGSQPQPCLPGGGCRLQRRLPDARRTADTRLSGGRFRGIRQRGPESRPAPWGSVSSQSRVRWPAPGAGPNRDSCPSPAMRSNKICSARRGSCATDSARGSPPARVSTLAPRDRSRRSRAVPASDCLPGPLFHRPAPCPTIECRAQDAPSRPAETWLIAAGMSDRPLK